MVSGLTAYRAAIDALFARTGSTSKFGLERTRELLALLGNPHQQLNTFHVAGTNGKGSVVITLYALLQSKGLRVGRYMSPHLIDFRERIVVAGETISEEYVLQFLDRWSKSAEELGATFFEITTAMAFHYFKSHDVDAAVIETGLGGRLDSTNVIVPLTSGITSIGMDHQEYLGDTEEKIAREKAGILKRGIPAVIGGLSTEARVAVYEVARSEGVPVVVEADRLYATHDVHAHAGGTSFSVEHHGETRTLTTGLVGAAQAGNAAVALAMLRTAGTRWSVTLDEAHAVLPSVTLPGRFQRSGNLILDVAHNTDGMRSLVATIKEVKPVTPVTAILGVLNDKDWRQMMMILSTVVERFTIVAPPSAPQPRAWDPVDAESFARSNGLDASFEPDFARAIQVGRKAEGTCIVTGSFHTVGDALAIIGENTL